MTTPICQRDPEFRTLERLLHDELSGRELSDAERHVAECPVCSKERWAMRSDHDLLAAAVQVPPTRAIANAAEIVERAGLGERRSSLQLVLAGAAIGLGVLLVARLVMNDEGREPQPVAMPASGLALPPLPDLEPPVPDPEILAAEGMTRPLARAGVPLDVPAGGDLALRLVDGSVLAVRADSRVTFGGRPEALVVNVERGEVQCRVTPRSASRAFSVVAPDLEVRVVGTVFVVRASAGGSRVHVAEGSVDVLRKGQATEHVVAAPLPEDVLTSPWIGEQPTEEVTEEARRHHGSEGLVAQAKRLLAERRYREARDVLGRHTASRPGDVDALYLLGEAERLGGDAAAAESTFERIAATAHGLVQANALARLAFLAERRGPSAVVDAWDRYLANYPSGPLAAEAMLRRANALVALGRRDEARGMLERFLRSFPEHPRRAEVEDRLRGR